MLVTNLARVSNNEVRLSCELKAQSSDSLNPMCQTVFLLLDLYNIREEPSLKGHLRDAALVHSPPVVETLCFWRAANHNSLRQGRPQRVVELKGCSKANYELLKNQIVWNSCKATLAVKMREKCISTNLHKPGFQTQCARLWHLNKCFQHKPPCSHEEHGNEGVIWAESNAGSVRQPWVMKLNLITEIQTCFWLRQEQPAGK